MENSFKITLPILVLHSFGIRIWNYIRVDQYQIKTSLDTLVKTILFFVLEILPTGLESLKIMKVLPNHNIKSECWPAVFFPVLLDSAMLHVCLWTHNLNSFKSKVYWYILLYVLSDQLWIDIILEKSENSKLSVLKFQP